MIFNTIIKGGSEDDTLMLNALIENNLTEIESDATRISAYAFYKKSVLKTAKFPNATEVGSYAFQDCTSLTSIDIPNAQVRHSAFEGCYKLINVNFPKATYINQAFVSCNSLETAIFPSAKGISWEAFKYCYSLIKVVIGINNTTVATLNRTPIYYPAFSTCSHILGSVHENFNPDGLKDGYIYVPLSLVAKYRVTTDWSPYASQIMPYVATVEELANIDGTTYDKACVGEDYIEYTYNGTSWEIYTR